MLGSKQTRRTTTQALGAGGAGVTCNLQCFQYKLKYTILLEHEAKRVDPSWWSGGGFKTDSVVLDRDVKLTVDVEKKLVSKDCLPDDCSLCITDNLELKNDFFLKLITGTNPETSIDFNPKLGGLNIPLHPNPNNLPLPYLAWMDPDADGLKPHTQTDRPGIPYTSFGGGEWGMQCEKKWKRCGESAWVDWFFGLPKCTDGSNHLELKTHIFSESVSNKKFGYIGVTNAIAKFNAIAEKGGDDVGCKLCEELENLLMMTMLISGSPHYIGSTTGGRDHDFFDDCDTKFLEEDCTAKKGKKLLEVFNNGWGDYGANKNKYGRPPWEPEVHCPNVPGCD